MRGYSEEERQRLKRYHAWRMDHITDHAGHQVWVQMRPGDVVAQCMTCDETPGEQWTGTKTQ